MSQSQYLHNYITLSSNESNVLLRVSTVESDVLLRLLKELLLRAKASLLNAELALAGLLSVLRVLR